MAVQRNLPQALVLRVHVMIVVNCLPSLLRSPSIASYPLVVLRLLLPGLTKTYIRTTLPLTNVSSPVLLPLQLSTRLKNILAHWPRARVVEVMTITTCVRLVVMGQFVKRQYRSHSLLTRRIRSKVALVTIMANMTLGTRRLPHHQVAHLGHAVLACRTGDLSHLKAFDAFPALRRGALHHRLLSRTDTRVLHLFTLLYPPVLPRPIPTTDAQRIDNDFMDQMNWCTEYPDIFV